MQTVLKSRRINLLETQGMSRPVQELRYLYLYSRILFSADETGESRYKLPGPGVLVGRGGGHGQAMLHIFFSFSVVYYLSIV